MTAGIGPVEKYKCTKCGHDCHCAWDQCDCACDVCDCGRTANSKEDIPSSFFTATNT